MEQEAERLRLDLQWDSPAGAADLVKLDKTADMIKAHRRFLISQTTRPIGDGHRVSCGLPDFLRQLEELNF